MKTIPRISNHEGFATHAGREIGAHGVFVADFKDLGFLWGSGKLSVREKIEQLFAFASAHGWRVRAGEGNTEVVFERDGDFASRSASEDGRS